MAAATSPSAGYSRARPTTSPRTVGAVMASAHDAYAASGSGPGAPPRIRAGRVETDSTRRTAGPAGTFSHVYAVDVPSDPATATARSSLSSSSSSLAEPSLVTWYGSGSTMIGSPRRASAE